MCGRFSLWLTLAELQEQWPNFIFPKSIPPRYNIAPTQNVAVVTNQGAGNVDFFRWGLIPFWTKDVAHSKPLINARAETVSLKPAFREAYQRRRCLILADGFYEWQAIPDSKTRTPMYIYMASGQPFAFAGLWEVWQADNTPIFSCTIITSRPNQLIAPFHNRMPVILPPSAYERWLNPHEQTSGSLDDLFQPYPADEMRLYPVADIVNSPMNDQPECIAPVVKEKPVEVAAIQYAREHQPHFLAELQEFLAIPSVSTKAEHQPAIQQAATWLRDKLWAAGFTQATLMPTAGHPIVYTEWLGAGEDAPTILVYGHYDVQPADPLDLWDTPPFEPTRVGDDLFARGASDDKGQAFIYVKVAEAFKNTVGTPPVNIKCLFEGEEEIGSIHLDDFIHEHQDLLAADVALISDSHILGKDIPAIVYGLRGLSYIEVRVTGPGHDLHSGIYGGAVNNPLNVLCRMIAQLQDEEGHIHIPGFYDQVRDVDAAERAALAKIPYTHAAWLEEAGVHSDWGEADYTVIERTSARPTLDVNGIWGGYTEPGAKTVLPSQASAKISMRLVPDQHPREITTLITQYLHQLAPPSVSIEVSNLHGGDGAIVNRDSAAMRAAFTAYARAFGVEPVFMREGGSIPVVATFQKELGIDTILMGFGLPDDRLHSPNEKFHLPNFYKGIETVIHFMTLFAE